MNKMKFSENETYQFVKSYLSHELLWNTDHKHHKLSTRRLKAYRDIITTLKDTTGITLNETEVRIKIKNLRSTYCQELAKIKNRSGPNGTYEPNMKWFKEWHKCYSMKRRPVEESSFDSHQEASEYLTEEPSIEPKIIIVQNEDKLRSTLVEDDVEAYPESDLNYILKSEPREVTEKQFRNSYNSYSNHESKRRRKNYRSTSTDCSTYLDNSYSNTNNSAPKEDEFDIYGKYIASQLRNMDLQRALKVQLEIQSLVSDARISDLNANALQ